MIEFNRRETMGKCEGCKRAKNAKGEYVYTCNCNVETMKDKKESIEEFFYKFYPSLKYEHKESTTILVSEAIDVLEHYATQQAEQSEEGIDEFLKMILNSYKVINKQKDYYLIYTEIVQQAEILNNKLIDSKEQQAEQSKVSDEDIEIYADENTESMMIRAGIIKGAKWMRNKLTTQTPNN